jgi:hypothetical protein
MNHIHYFLLSLFFQIGFCQLATSQSSTLILSILDNSSNEIVPARVELSDSTGIFYIAEDALLVGGDCDMSDSGAGLVDLESTLKFFSKDIKNPYTNSSQFYSEGESSIKLSGGRYYIRIYKGTEFKVHMDTIDLMPGEIMRYDANLIRWINMPEKNWYSADDHLHIPRPVKELDPYISKMMQGEDIHVANLLQMGKVRNFEISPQYSHGANSYYQEGNYILAAGQENPRTHFLGHTITLGAREAIHNPEKYLIYRLIWEEAIKQGGINGYAHGFADEGHVVSPHNGLAILLPYNLMHFMEVLQFNRSDYDIWYDILNLGFKVTPTAGTDYPCADQSLPGHERFYTKVHGDLTYENWLEGVRNGRTFVTTGPIIEFLVNNQDIGSEIILNQADSVRISGTVLFDPAQDNLNMVEILRNGYVIQRVSRIEKSGRIDFNFQYPVAGTCWFALRGRGDKQLENTWMYPGHFTIWKPLSNFHSAPIFVTLPNMQNENRKKVAESWMARLIDLENLLAEDNIDYLAQKLETPNFDAVPKEVLVNNRKELLKEIAVSKKYFQELLKD